MSFLSRFPGSGMDLTLYALNLTGRIPPWVNVEQSYDGFTHDPKGHPVTMALTWRLGGGRNGNTPVPRPSGPLHPSITQNFRATPNSVTQHRSYGYHVA